MKFLFSFSAFLMMGSMLLAQPKLQIQTYVTGFTKPVDIVNAGDDRLFIVEQDGRIRIIQADGTVRDTPFLNIDPIVNSASNERGLLGLAFHPNYAENGYFYVNYINNSGNTHISRFSVDPNNPNIADPQSELLLLEVAQPYSNHNAGDLNFGPDGYLYFGLGDGGSGGDPQANGQNRQKLLGKMLRLDVDNGDPYTIPPTNPFAQSTDTRPEIWAIGLRNPWRFSFDRLTGDMWIGDVGQDSWEEVDFQPAGSTGGENYGWRCYEGLVPFNTSGCGPESDYTKPVQVYANNSQMGCSITGGFVYRGSQYPDLYGHYLYTDYCSGRIWSLYPNPQGGFFNTQLLQGASGQYVSFGENSDGELFLAGISSGIIYRVVELCSPFTVEGMVTNFGCPGAAEGEIQLEISDNSAAYTLAWSNGDTSAHVSSLAPGSYTVTATNAIGCQRILDFGIPVIDPIPFSITFDGEFLHASVGFLSYTWMLNGEVVATTTEPNFLPTETGEFSVQAFDANGCIYLSQSINVVIESITEADLGLQKLVLSPNPFKNTLRVEIDAASPGNFRLRLLDFQGQILKDEMEWVGVGFSKTLDLSAYPAGTYLLSIGKGGKELVRKVQKQL